MRVVVVTVVVVMMVLIVILMAVAALVGLAASEAEAAATAMVAVAAAEGSNNLQFNPRIFFLNEGEIKGNNNPAANRIVQNGTVAFIILCQLGVPEGNRA